MNTGGPAFPQMLSRMQWDEDDQIRRTMIDSTGGMTLRDYFAGQMLTFGPSLADVQYHVVGETPEERSARIAYRYADAMLKAREA